MLTVKKYVYECSECNTETQVNGEKMQTHEELFCLRCDKMVMQRLLIETEYVPGKAFSVSDFVSRENMERLK